MRTINKNEIGDKLIALLEEENPIDEDIRILDENGSIAAAIITSDAYQFFLKKIEEEEDRIDNRTVQEFHNSGEMNNEK